MYLTENRVTSLETRDHWNNDIIVASRNDQGRCRHNKTAISVLEKPSLDSSLVDLVEISTLRRNARRGGLIFAREATS